MPNYVRVRTRIECAARLSAWVKTVGRYCGTYTCTHAEAVGLKLAVLHCCGTVLNVRVSTLTHIPYCDT